MAKFSREFDFVVNATQLQTSIKEGGAAVQGELTYLTLRQFAINFGLMSWSSSQIESDERALVYAIWRILQKNPAQADVNGGTVSAENLERILTIILRLPLEHLFAEEETEAIHESMNASQL